jgi:hypothetical protein
MGDGLGDILWRIRPKLGLRKAAMLQESIRLKKRRFLGVEGGMEVLKAFFYCGGKDCRMILGKRFLKPYLALAN